MRNKNLFLPDLLRIEEVKHPLEKGTNYLVPCIVKEQDETIYFLFSIGRKLFYRNTC